MLQVLFKYLPFCGFTNLLLTNVIDMFDKIDEVVIGTCFLKHHIAVVYLYGLLLDWEMYCCKDLMVVYLRLPSSTGNSRCSEAKVAQESPIKKSLNVRMILGRIVLGIGLVATSIQSSEVNLIDEVTSTVSTTQYLSINSIVWWYQVDD
ncbi:hypothetical protein ACFX13_014000 [Malus domestica]